MTCSHPPCPQCLRDGTCCWCGLEKHGSPLRRLLRAEKASANAQAYHSVCRAWEALPGCGITWRNWNRIAKAGGMIRR